MWFVRPQLFFHCTLRPIRARVGSHNRCDEDIPLDLVFFSPFEEFHLLTAGIMESRKIHRVYEPSPVPTLYVGRVEDLLGRVPLVPCFLDVPIPIVDGHERCLAVRTRNQAFVHTIFA